MSWDKEALGRLHQKIESSGTFLALFSEKYKEDPTALVQIVFAMMLDKPIYILAEKGAKVPPKFAKIADGIEYYTDKNDLLKVTEKLIREATTQ